MIDIKGIQPGAIVSVTLRDGSKIIDTPVVEAADDDLIIADGGIMLRAGKKLSGRHIASIDAYTPPEPLKPWWDRFGVDYVIDRDHDLWLRDDMDEWRIAIGGISLESEDLEVRYGPCVPLIRVEVTDEMVAAAAKSWREAGFSYTPNRARAALMVVLEAALGIEAHE